MRVYEDHRKSIRVCRLKAGRRTWRRSPVARLRRVRGNENRRRYFPRSCRLARSIESPAGTAARDKGGHELHELGRCAKPQREAEHRPTDRAQDLFLKFARYIPNGPVPTQEALRLVRAWISEYGVLGLAGADDGLNAGRRESVRGFWKAASQAAMILNLYEAAIPKKPDQMLGEVLVRWEPGVDWSGISVSDQREYALGRVGDVVGRIVKEECYPLLWRQVNKTRSKTQGFTYDFGFHSLLGAMYLQMMLLLTDANNVRQCQRPGCQRIIPPHDRSDKKTCSDACRKWISENK